MAYPLRGINRFYKKVVRKDLQVNVGSLLTRWNPLSHVEYWVDDDVKKLIAAALAKVWRAVNR